MSNELEIKLARLEEKQISESASLRENMSGLKDNMSEVKSSLALINTKLDNIAVAENSKLLTNQELKMTVVDLNKRLTETEKVIEGLKGLGWKILAGGGLAGLGGAGVIDLIAKALTG